VGSARSFVLVAVAWFAAVGCEGDPAPADEEIPPPPYASFDARPCPNDSVLTWENFGQPFMRNWCTSCHADAVAEEGRAGAPLSINFDDLDGVRDHAARIWARGGDQNNTMPPAGVPPELERAQLGEWLACGARSRDD
jgi:hypothetical protein